MTGLVLLSGDNAGFGRGSASRRTRLRVRAPRTNFVLNGMIAGPVLGGGLGREAELLGRSFLKRMSSKVRNVAHTTLDVATKIPGISSVAQGARTAGSVVDATTQAAGKNVLSDAGSFLVRKAQEIQSSTTGQDLSKVQSMAKTGMSKVPWWVWALGGIVVVGGGTTILIRRRN